MARPVYLMLPTDLAYERIPSYRLKTPLSTEPPANDPDVEQFALDEIAKLIEEAGQDAIILVDACAIRHSVKKEVHELIQRTGFPAYAAPMGKTAVDEQHERYGGIYVGSISHPEIKEKVENAKVIISIGALKSDFNTGNFTYHIPTSRTIELHSDHTTVQFAEFPGIGMKRLLPKLTARIQPFQPDAKLIPVPSFTLPLPQEDNDIITQTYLWPRMGQFFRPKDIIVAETGTSSFGVLEVPFPSGAVFISQILWGSIGWTVGSTLGAALAGRDLGYKRTILFIGDGSLQLTVQELSAMLRSGVTPIIFVLNNAGYTIERFLHGMERKYNDIANWRWTKLLETFGGEEGKTCQSYLVKTKQELSALLDDPKFAAADKIQLVEMIMQPRDAPRALKRQAELSGKTNRYVAELPEGVGEAV